MLRDDIRKGTAAIDPELPLFGIRHINTDTLCAALVTQPVA